MSEAEVPTPGSNMLYWFPRHPHEMVVYEINDDYLYIMYMENGELERYLLSHGIFRTVYDDGVGFELNVAFNLRRLP